MPFPEGGGVAGGDCVGVGLPPEPAPLPPGMFVTAMYCILNKDTNALAVSSAGWTGMGFTDPAGVRRVLAPEEARLFEWRSRGPGAAPAAPTRRQLSDTQADGFTPAAILQGWAP